MKKKKDVRFGSRFFMALIGIFLYAPIVLLVVFSFNAGNSNTVWKGFSLMWYAKLFQNRIIMQSVYTTLLVSLLATVIATVVLPERLTMGFGTLLIAHVCFNIPYVILSVGPKLRQMDKNLVDAAQDLGCTWMQAFWKVILPEIKPGIVSGALTAFTMSIDDFVISYFTAGSSVSTLAMTIYGMAKKRVSPQINAISALLFGTVLLLLVIINVRESRQERKTMQQR